jgi:hypothetical protein
VNSEAIKFEGGILTEAAPMSRPAGSCLFATNYEIPPQGGYRRIDGYTLVDGSETPAGVPGSGPVRGVFIYDDKRYAIRDNAAGTQGVLHVESAGGWTALDLGIELAFDAGSGQIFEGDEIVGMTSLAAATVGWINVTSGDWSTNDAAGYITAITHTGTFQDNENIQVGGVTKAVANGTETTNTLAPGGDYEFAEFNFYATSSTKRIYGVSAVDNAWEFDGTHFAKIHTGMTLDLPDHVAAFKNFLFLSFPGGSVQHSAAGEPHTWDAILGAAELGVGDNVTGLSVETGGVLAITSRNRIHILSGTGAILSGGGLDWTLTEFSSNSGAIAKTVQRLGQTVFLDDRGLSALSASDRFGDFASGTFSVGFRPLIASLIDAGVSCSVLVKEKDQYRLFFEGGRGLCCTFAGDKFTGATTFDFPVTVKCAYSAEIAGVETVIFGDENGNVYDMDKGTSFNGTAIMSLLRPQYYHYKSPNRRKRFRRLLLEAEASTNVTFSVVPDFGYSSGDIPRAISHDFSMYGSGGFWNDGEWNDFNWSVPISPNTPVRIAGIGSNLSPLFYHESATDSSFTLYGMVTDFDYRGQMR